MIAALRDSVRTWRRSPGIALVAAFSLALGIGATTAAFSVVEQLLLRPLAVSRPHELYEVAVGPQARVTFPVWEQIDERRHLFENAYALELAGVNLASAGETDSVPAAFASASIFDTLSVAPVLGRAFDAHDDSPTGGPDGHVAVIGHTFWLRRFNGDPAAVGRTLAIERVPFTIVGVLPASLPGVMVSMRTDILLPLRSLEAVYGRFATTASRSRNSLQAIVRLAPSRPVGDVVAALRADQADIRQATLPPNAPATFRERFLAAPFELRPAPHGGGNPRFMGEPATIALGLAAAVLLAACGNVAMVLLVHGATRRRELGVRAALGAAPWDGVRQRFADSAVLAAAGAAGGLALAHAGSGWLTAQLDTIGYDLVTSFSTLTGVGADWRAATAGIAAGLVTALVCGVAPAVVAARVRPHDALKRSDPHHTGTERAQQVVAAVQLALAVAIILVGSLLFQSYRVLAANVATFDPKNAFVADLRFWRSAVAAPAREAMVDDVLRAVRALPGAAAAAANNFPFVGGSYLWHIDGPGDDEPPYANVNSVSTGFFDVVRAPILAGRMLDARDVAGAPMAGVATRRFARAYLGGESKVPQTVWRTLPPSNDRQAIEVVGVVDDMPPELMETPEPQLLIARAQDTPENFNVYLLARTSTATSVAALRTAIAQAAPAVSFTVRPYEDYAWRLHRGHRLLGRLAAFFVGLAALLAVVGVFGVFAYSVAVRQREFGVRVALGAGSAQIYRFVLRRAGTLVVVGAIVGLGASTWLARLAATQLPGVSATDPRWFAAVGAITSVIGVAAAWIPARRAAHVDPIVVLRDE